MCFPPRDVSPQNVAKSGDVLLLEFMKTYKSSEMLTRWLVAITSFSYYPTPLLSFNHVSPSKYNCQINHKKIAIATTACKLQDWVCLYFS